MWKKLLGAVACWLMFASLASAQGVTGMFKYSTAAFLGEVQSQAENHDGVVVWNCRALEWLHGNAGNTVKIVIDTRLGCATSLNEGLSGVFFISPVDAGMRTTYGFTDGYYLCSMQIPMQLAVVSAESVDYIRAIAAASDVAGIRTAAVNVIAHGNPEVLQWAVEDLLNVAGAQDGLTPAEFAQITERYKVENSGSARLALGQIFWKRGDAAAVPLLVEKLTDATLIPLVDDTARILTKLGETGDANAVTAALETALDHSMNDKPVAARLVETLGKTHLEGAVPVLEAALDDIRTTQAAADALSLQATDGRYPANKTAARDTLRRKSSLPAAKAALQAIPAE